MNKVLVTRGFALMISLVGLTIAAVLSGCGSTGATAPSPQPTTETLTLACPGYVQSAVADPALSCAAKQNGDSDTNVTYSTNVAPTVATVSATGVITTDVLNGPPVEVTVTATEKTTGKTAAAKLYVVNWLLGWFVTINGQSSIVVTAADGSNVKTVLTSACSMSKWLHSRLGFTCIDGNSVKVYTVNVAEDGTPSSVTLAMTMPLSITPTSPAAGSPDGTTFVVEGREYKTDAWHYGVYAGTLADNKTNTTLIEQDEVCTESCLGPSGPSWNESQSSIVYNHISGTSAFVYTMTAMGGNATAVVDNPPNEAGLGVFSTDANGAEIFYTQVSADGYGPGTYVVPSNGGTSTLLIPNANASVQGPGNQLLATATTNGIMFNNPTTGKLVGSIPTTGVGDLSW